MIAIKQEVTRIIHEPREPFNIIESDLGDSSTERPPSNGLFPWLEISSPRQRARCSSLIAGDVSKFDAVVPEVNLRFTSVPVMYGERSVSLTFVYSGVGERPESTSDNADPIVSKMLEVVGSAICVIDPLSSLVTQFNRKFAEIWKLDFTNIISRYGLPLSVLQNRVDQMARVGSDAQEFLRLNRTNDDAHRLLPLDDQNTMVCKLVNVPSQQGGAYRILATFEIQKTRDAQREREALQTFNRLTPRQEEVVQCVACGLSNIEIGNRLGVGVKTIEKHRAMAVAKLKVDSVPELVRFVDYVAELRQS